MVGRQHGERQDEDTVTAQRGFQAVGIYARLADAPAVPEEILIPANHNRIGEQVNRIDLQLEPEHTVAAVLSLQAVGIGAGFGELASTPFAETAAAYLLFLFHQVGGIHCQLQAVDAVAAMQGHETVLIHSGRIQQPAAPHAGLRPADFQLFGKMVGGPDNQVQPVNAVATVR